MSTAETSVPTPVPTPVPTRARLVGAAGELFRRQGYAATGIKAVLESAHAPYGSLYHFFPGGKAELGVAVIDDGARTFEELVRTHFAPPDDVVTLVRSFFDGAALVVEGSDSADACPVATFAGEVAAADEGMRAAAAAAFRSWIDALTERLVADGLDTTTARELATNGFCLLEGAFLLARVTRDAEPVRAAGRAMAMLTEEALAARSPVGSF